MEGLVATDIDVIFQLGGCGEEQVAVRIAEQLLKFRLIENGFLAGKHQLALQE